MGGWIGFTFYGERRVVVIFAVMRGPTRVLAKQQQGTHCIRWLFRHDGQFIDYSDDEYGDEFMGKQ